MEKLFVAIVFLTLVSSCTEISCQTKVKYHEEYGPYAEDILKYNYIVPVLDEENNLRVIIIQDTCTSCSDKGMAIGKEKQAGALVASEEVLKELKDNLETLFQVSEYHYIGNNTEEGTFDLTKWSINKIKKATTLSGCCSEQTINATMNACWWKEGFVAVPNFRQE